MRSRVDYHWPGTRAGDGKPVKGSAFYDLRPIEAWDRHEYLVLSGRRGVIDEVIDRAERVS